jgi:TPP-dependent pyruvate/acetoin dehydrogenase alpha subunit
MVSRRGLSLSEKHSGLHIAETGLDIPAATLRAMYITMLRIRRFEEKVAELVYPLKEIICPCHLYIGQETVAAGVCSALKKEDWVFSAHRSHGHYIAKGGDTKTLMAELYEKETGCSRGRGGSMHLSSAEQGLPGSSAIVAGTVPLALGAALAFSMLADNSKAKQLLGWTQKHSLEDGLTKLIEWYKNYKSEEWSKPR